MANIVLTTYCNLHCPYCFADTMIETEKIKNISLEQFKKTLDWIGEDEPQIGLIGGEPTLHPQFKEILEIIDDYSKKRRFMPHFVLFTNGVYLDKYIQDLPECVEILINVNQPSAMTEEQYERMVNNLRICDRLGWLLKDKSEPGRVTLGCNICQEITDYSFFFEILDQFNIKVVRSSVVAPTDLKDKMNKVGYYTKMKPIYLDFMKRAIKQYVYLNQDCNQIPECFFSESEKQLVRFGLEDGFIHPFVCDPVIDITPDFKASSCFGAYELIDCKDFNNVGEFMRYAHFKVMYPKVQGNDDGPCATCKKFKCMQCQGGCLAFSKYKKEED